MWESPDHVHWMAILAHVVMDNWKPITLLLYMGKLGVEHTDQNQADRIISVFRKNFDVGVANVCGASVRTIPVAQQILPHCRKFDS